MLIRLSIIFNTIVKLLLVIVICFRNVLAEQDTTTDAMIIKKNDTDSKDFVPGHLRDRVNLSNRSVFELARRYHMSLVIVSLSATVPCLNRHPQYNPLKAKFYTAAYRMGLRHFSGFSDWLYGTGTYYSTHRIWHKEYNYIDQFIPAWMRYMIPWVNKDEWEKEENNYKSFVRSPSSRFFALKMPNA